MFVILVGTPGLDYAPVVGWATGRELSDLDAAVEWVATAQDVQAANRAMYGPSSQWDRTYTVVEVE